MEGELFDSLYQLITQLSTPRGKRQQYSDGVIVAIYLWAVINDRPMNWACNPHHAPPQWDRPLPSISCLSRRMKAASAQLLLQRLLHQVDMRRQAAMLMLLLIDSKPLVVGVYSKDRHARWGYIGKGRKARGYRLHVVVTSDGQLVAWTVASMNEGDSVVAARLVDQFRAQGYLLGDSAYDSNPLHACCARRGLRLLAPRKRPHTGLGCRRHEPTRLQSAALLETPSPGASDFGRELYQRRGDIERLFGRWTSTAGGLSLALPAWVRGPRRVATWIAAKLLLLTTHRPATAA